MGAYKAIAMELEELEAEVNFDCADDIFDLVVDAQLGNTKLSPLMIRMIWGTLGLHSDSGNPIDRLWSIKEFRDVMAWHEMAL
jgi:hypothetical protein